MSQTYLGIELGSTRVKAVLTDGSHRVLAAGAHAWESRLENGIWTYSLEAVWDGLRDCVAALIADARGKGVSPEHIGCIGISAMMHGYLAFGGDGAQLVPFRTWRNTNAAHAAARLTESLGVNMPTRWSAAHLYQAVLDGEPHIRDLAFVTTLAGYTHWQLTGQKVLGIGDASGMFPIDSGNAAYDAALLEKFDALTGLDAAALFPRVLTAGEPAGTLTERGAALLDPSGTLKPGIPLCPPEGDAGTGMAATNSVSPRMGNVSAGTSAFAMVVLERPLSRVYPEIDMVTTPSGSPVAMAHANNCTSDIDAWARLFGDAAGLFGRKPDASELYAALYAAALDGEADCGGLLAYNCFAGEPTIGLREGRPLLARLPDSRFTPQNVMRTLLYSAIAVLKLGMDVLASEGVKLERLLGHGGFFKNAGAGQRFLAAALGVPVAVMETAGEGGAWGAALLAAYAARKQPGETLEAYLEHRVFSGGTGTRV
ncbi:MAG: ATPase, partial [Clostridiales bacterium]|nr:ATPase [Clostridiales bacterium]